MGHHGHRAGNVPTFFKSFRSVLERGPSARLFRSRSFFQSFRSRSVPFQIVPIFLGMRSMRSFFFRNDGVVLDRCVRFCERTIVPQERRPALLVHGGFNSIVFKFPIEYAWKLNMNNWSIQ